MPARLESARLATRADGRWRLLGPIRETLVADLPPVPEDRARLVVLFLARAAKAEAIGATAWKDVRDEVIPEAGNLDAIVGLATREPVLPPGLAPAVGGLAQLYNGTGLAAVTSLPAAARRFNESGNLFGEANCLYNLGDIAYLRSDLAGARRHYDAALPLYEKVPSTSGEANCILGLGNVAFAQSDHQEARRRYNAARLLYKQLGSVLGEASCLKGLGSVALELSDHKEARRQYEAALTLYETADAALGQANCIQGLGDIALELAEYKEARNRYDAALPLYKQLGSVLGEANCTQGLADVALAFADHETGRQQYGTGLRLFRRVGQSLGEANCTQGLGDVEAAKHNVAAACGLWRDALALYQKIPEPKSIGHAHLRLARLAATPEEAAAHREAARTASESIGRQDLIDHYLDGG